MANYQPVSLERHRDKRWKRVSGYEFTQNEALCPIVAMELPRAMHTLPLGFCERNGGYIPVVIMGLQPGENLLVAEGGRWRAPYVPQAYLTYPFILAEKDNERILCIDEDAGIPADESTLEGTEPFFEEDGNPTSLISSLLQSLNEVATNREQTRIICKQFQDMELLEPWPISATIKEQTVNVSGIYRIDEEALNQLPAEDFMNLRDSRALIVAYCQLLSMSHIHSLITLAQRPGGTESISDISFDSFDDGGTLNFDNF